jgi:phosphomevalonate kinase
MDFSSHFPSRAFSHLGLSPISGFVFDAFRNPFVQNQIKNTLYLFVPNLRKNCTKDIFNPVMKMWHYKRGGTLEGTT